MTHRILTPAQVQGAHDYLAGRPTPLDEPLNASAAGDSLALPVTPETVFYTEALFRLAQDKGLRPEMMTPEGLNPREAEFVSDFNHFFLGIAPPSEANPSTVFEDAVALLTHGLPAIAGLGRRPAPLPQQFPSAVLIGAYGGEHVGDAAILGGVLLGLHKDFGVTEVMLLSKRPEHTKRLVAALETPVNVRVAPYSHRDLDAAIKQHAALVFAGGPLMDLPRMLVMHLKAARLAARVGKPFVVRNVGVGPFKRQASRMVARQIARAASAFSVRTRDAAKDPILHGLKVAVGHDPAFDYLASRGTLTRLTEDERKQVDDLLHGTEGRPLLGINIRPIRHEWAKKGEDFSRRAETGFLQACAEAMARVATSLPTPPVFVFFPMNPIQLGGSDLESAFHLQKLLGGRAEMRVLQSDPDVDGVLYLLRKLDAAMTMRFHGSIFALSQEIPTAGVDYYPGQGGKVEQLFQDRGLHDLIRRMDTADEDWIFTSMTELLAGHAGR